MFTRRNKPRRLPSALCFLVQALTAWTRRHTGATFTELVDRRPGCVLQWGPGRIPGYLRVTIIHLCWNEHGRPLPVLRCTGSCSSAQSASCACSCTCFQAVPSQALDQLALHLSEACVCSLEAAYRKSAATT